MLTEEQLAARRNGIGGSDVGAICGKNKWMTIQDVYLDKKGLRPPRPESPQAKWGKIQEPYICANYCEVFNKEVFVPNETYYHKDYPFMLANVDGLIETDGILEVKTVTYNNAEWGATGTDQIPKSYALQCHHYMLVCDRAYTDIALLSMGYKESFYRIYRDSDIDKKLIEIESWFWNECVLKDQPPLARADKMINEMNAVLDKPLEGSIYNADMMDAFHQLLHHMELRKFHADEEETYKKYIGDFLQGCQKESLQSKDGVPLVTYKLNKRSSMDTKSFQQEHPELYEKYLRETKYYYFKVLTGQS